MKTVKASIAKRRVFVPPNFSPLQKPLFEDPLTLRLKHEIINFRIQIQITDNIFLFKYIHNKLNIHIKKSIN